LKILLLLKKITTRSCVLYTILITATYLLGVYISPAWIPTLKMVVSLLLFSIVLSVGSEYLSSNHLIYPLRLCLHFIVTAVLFFMIFVSWTGLSKNGGTVTAIMVMFLLGYIVITAISLLIKYLKEENKKSKKSYGTLFDKNKNTQYNSQFTNKK